MALSRQACPNAAVAVARATDPRPSRPVLMVSTAALVAALFLWAGGAFAHETQGQATDPAPSAQTPDEAGTQGTATDALVATVGNAEIRSSDLRQTIGQLPRP
jgi:hypothetical protein